MNVLESFSVAEYANVQRTQAHRRTWRSSYLRAGDTILAMDLDAGGPDAWLAGEFLRPTLRSGHGVREDNERLDYDEIRSLALSISPR